MRWVLSLLLAGSLAWAHAPAGGGPTLPAWAEQVDGRPAWVRDRLLVRVREGALPARREGLAALADCPALAALGVTRGLRGDRALLEGQERDEGARRAGLDRDLVLELAAGSDLEAERAAWAARPEVEWAEPDWLVRALLIPNDTYFNQQWGLRNTGQAPGNGTPDCDIDADEAWDLYTGSVEVAIAIIDTGVDLNHPDLQAKIIAGHDFVNNDEVPDDDMMHGTACASLAAALSNNAAGVSGVDWQARIMPIKVLDSGGSGSTTNIIAGVNWARTHNAGVISMSLGGGGFSSSFNAAITAAHNAGVVVVSAAGNDDSSTISYPAAYANSMAIGALSPCNQRKSPSSCDGETWWGSNYGTGLDVMAPGVLLRSATINGYISDMNGTSGATPHVAGAAALVKGANPSLSAAEIWALLNGTADDLGTPGWDAQTGYGRLNVRAALLEAMTSYGLVRGVVRDGGGLPLQGARVASEDGHEDFSGAGGAWELRLAAGEHTLTAGLYGYATVAQLATVAAGDTLALDFTLPAVPNAALSGVVRGADNQPLAGAYVQVAGPNMPAIAPQVTPGDGSFSFTLPVGQPVSLSCQGNADSLSAPLGPDAHGYRAFDPGDADWDGLDLTIAAGGNQVVLKGKNRAVYAWNTIDPEAGGPGTALNFSGGDDITLTVTLPFPFTYYGQTYTQASICGNGWVALGATTSVEWRNSPIPDATVGPPAMIAGIWEDYSPQQAASGNISTWHDAEGGRFIVEFHHIRQWTPDTAFESFQMILLDPVLHPTVTGDGAIIVQYDEISDLSSVSCGIESPDQTVGLQYLYSNEPDVPRVYGAGCPELATGLAVLYTTGLQGSSVLLPVTDLAITMESGLQPRLSWSASAGATSYRVERAGADGQWQALGETSATTWTDSFGPGVRLYRVIALNQD
jgi:thermitase